MACHLTHTFSHRKITQIDRKEESTEKQTRLPHVKEPLIHVMQ